MEIYNENAYDILEDKHLTTPIESWTKVGFQEDDFGNIKLKNISVVQIFDEELGLELLRKGCYIR
jgi:kinesin family protein 6/9